LTGDSTIFLGGIKNTFYDRSFEIKNTFDFGGARIALIKRLHAVRGVGIEL
jgi:hypothetical protein